MSILLADIDATCAALGYYDNEGYLAEPDALQGLRVSSLRIFMPLCHYN